MIESLVRFRSTAWYALTIVGIPILSQGCALHRDGTKEVAAYIQECAAVQASDGAVYARLPASGKEPPTPDREMAEARTLDVLRDFIVVALENHPDIKAAEETAQSKAERIVQITALPDPMVTTRTLPEPIRTAEGDNFFNLGISKRFPVPEKLDRAGRIALEAACGARRTDVLLLRRALPAEVSVHARRGQAGG